MRFATFVLLAAVLFSGCVTMETREPIHETNMVKYEVVSDVPTVVEAVQFTNGNMGSNSTLTEIETPWSHEFEGLDAGTNGTYAIMAVDERQPSEVNIVTTVRVYVRSRYDADYVLIAENSASGNHAGPLASANFRF